MPPEEAMVRRWSCGRMRLALLFTRLIFVMWPSVTFASVPMRWLSRILERWSLG